MAKKQHYYFVFLLEFLMQMGNETCDDDHTPANEVSFLFTFSMMLRFVCVRAYVCHAVPDTSAKHTMFN